MNWFAFEELGELDNPEVYDRLAAIMRDVRGASQSRPLVRGANRIMRVA